jgi:hypothetical protein
MHNNEEIFCYLLFNQKDWMYNKFVMGFGPTFCSLYKQTNKYV